MDPTAASVWESNNVFDGLNEIDDDKEWGVEQLKNSAVGVKILRNKTRNLGREVEADAETYSLHSLFKIKFLHKPLQWFV